MTIVKCMHPRTVGYILSRSEKKIRTIFLGHLYSFSIQENSKIQRGIRIWREKNEKKYFLGLNRPFIEVSHFENTMAIDLEILSDTKIKIRNSPKWYILI